MKHFKITNPEYNTYYITGALPINDDDNLIDSKTSEATIVLQEIIDVLRELEIFNSEEPITDNNRLLIEVIDLTEEEYSQLGEFDGF